MLKEVHRDEKLFEFDGIFRACPFLLLTFRGSEVSCGGGISREGGIFANCQMTKKKLHATITINPSPNILLLNFWMLLL